jgi:phosphoribosylanthranilate isomerase
MTKVKICGIGKVENAQAAVDAGADFLGIVFEPNSRRRLEVEEAKTIIESTEMGQWPVNAKWVGVFANQLVEEVNRIVEYCGIDLVQLSGNESPEYCSKMVRPVVKVIHVRSDSNQVSLTEIRNNISLYEIAGCSYMLDTFKKGVLGGTGQVFNWDIAKVLSEETPLFLAGGLNIGNVSEAIVKVRPWALDVSSGVESDGQKDSAKINAFIDKVREIDNS